MKKKLKSNFREVSIAPEYYINEEGTVLWSTYKNRSKSIRIGDSGYKTVDIVLEGKNKIIALHILVNLTFNGDRPFPNAITNHIDGDKFNNHYTNLEWTDHSGNLLHAYRTGLRGKVPLEKKEEVFKVLIEEGISLKQAMEILGINRTSLTKGFLQYYKGTQDEDRSKEVITYISRKKLIVEDLRTNKVIIYKSLTHAERDLKIDKRSIHAAIGRTSYKKLYKFTYEKKPYE